VKLTDLAVTDYRAQGYKPAGMILVSLFLIGLAIFFFVFITLALARRGPSALIFIVLFAFPLYICDFVGRVNWGWYYSNQSLKIANGAEYMPARQISMESKVDTYKIWQAVIIVVSIGLVILGHFLLHGVSWLLTVIILVGFVAFLAIGKKSRSSKSSSSRL
jgi:energy-coupling factor transporter transmembrane protein EcfT